MSDVLAVALLGISCATLIFSVFVLQAVQKLSHQPRLTVLDYANIGTIDATLGLPPRFDGSDYAEEVGAAYIDAYRAVKVKENNK